MVRPPPRAQQPRHHRGRTSPSPHRLLHRNHRSPRAFWIVSWTIPQTTSSTAQSSSLTRLRRSHHLLSRRLRSLLPVLRLSLSPRPRPDNPRVLRSRHLDRRPSPSLRSIPAARSHPSQPLGRRPPLRTSLHLRKSLHLLRQPLLRLRFISQRAASRTMAAFLPLLLLLPRPLPPPPPPPKIRANPG